MPSSEHREIEDAAPPAAAGSSGSGPAPAPARTAGAAPAARRAGRSKSSTAATAATPPHSASTPRQPMNGASTPARAPPAICPAMAKTTSTAERHLAVLDRHRVADRRQGQRHDAAGAPMPVRARSDGERLRSGASGASRRRRTAGSRARPDDPPLAQRIADRAEDRLDQREGHREGGRQQRHPVGRGGEFGGDGRHERVRRPHAERAGEGGQAEQEDQAAGRSRRGARQPTGG